MFCQVEGSTTIISLLPEGTKVKKGQLVCELDSSALQDRLKNQRIATLGAEAAYRTPSEVAEIAVKVEYPKSAKEFQTMVAKAKADEHAKKQTWELEKEKEANLESQIKNCKLLAPGDGIVVYGNDPSRLPKHLVRSWSERRFAIGRSSSACPTSMARCG